jgi:HEAT repeat protein
MPDPCIRALCFTGDHLWSAGARTLIWPLAGGEPRSIATSPADLVHHQGVVWALEGRRLTALTPAGEPTGREVALPFEGRVLAACGDHLAAAGPGAAALVDPATSSVAAVVRFSGAPADLDVGPDARLLIVVDQTLLRFEPDGRALPPLSPGRGDPLSARLGAGAILLAGGQRRGLGRLAWSERRATAHVDGVHRAAGRLSLDSSRRLAVSHWQGRVQVMDLEARASVAGARLLEEASTAAAVEGPWVAVGGAGGAVALLNRASAAARVLGGRELQPPRCLAHTRLAVRATGRRAGIAWVLDDEGRLYELTPAAPGPVQVAALDLEVRRRGFHERGQVLAVGEQRWLLERGGERYLLRAFARDGRPLWSLETGCDRLTRAPGGGWLGMDRRGAVCWLTQDGEGPPAQATVAVNPDEEALMSLRFQPVPAGDGALVLSWYPRDRAEQQYYLWTPGHAPRSMGEAVGLWPGLDERGFVLVGEREGWIWRGGEGPEGRWPEGLPERGWAGTRRLYALGEADVVSLCDGWGRPLASLVGHGEWIAGLVTDPGETRAITLDRHGNLRWWDLSALPEGRGAARIQRAEGWRWPAQRRAEREGSLPPDPTTGEQLAQIDAAFGDPSALRRLGWRLPAAVSEAVDARLTGALGDWRPAAVVRGARVNRWLKRSHDERPEERAAAAWALGLAGWEGLAGLARLAALLADPALEVREQAAGSLARLGRFAAPAAGALVEALERLGERGRRHAARALRSGGEAAQVARLLRHPDEGLRALGAEILRDQRRGARAALPALIAASAPPSGPRLRQLCCEALGAAGEPAALPALAALLEDEVGAVRGAAARAAAGAGGRDALPLLLGALEDRNRWVRYCAVEGLLSLADALDGAQLAAVARALAPLLEAPEEGGALLYLRALARFGGGQAVARLAALLEAEDPYAVRAAAEALAGLGPIAAAAAPALERALGRGWDPETRTALALALAAVGGAGAAAALAPLAARGATERRAEAVAALGRLRDPGARQAVAAALEDEAPRVRLAAALAVGPDLERLVALLEEDEDPELAPEILRQIGAPGRGGRAAAPALYAALRRRDPETWLAAMQALEDLGLDPWAAPLVINAQQPPQGAPPCPPPGSEPSASPASPSGALARAR